MSKKFHKFQRIVYLFDRDGDYPKDGYKFVTGIMIDPGPEVSSIECEDTWGEYYYIAKNDDLFDYGEYMMCNRNEKIDEILIIDN